MSDVEILDAPQVEWPPSFRNSQDKCSQEHAAFLSLLPSLLASCRDQFVAIHEGQVVASGTVELQVVRDAYARFGRVALYVGKVTDELPLLGRIPSPLAYPRAGQP